MFKLNLNIIALALLSSTIFFSQADQSLNDKLHDCIDNYLGTKSDLINLFIAGADINSKDPQGMSVLHKAYNIELAQVFIERGADINLLDNNSRTPLHNTVKQNRLSIAKILLKAGVDITIKDAEGKTALDMAEGYHDKAFIDLIKQHSKKKELKKFTFKDLAGDIPYEVLELMAFLKDREEYKQIGAQMPNGILLVGPPGTGKTSIARAIAGEIDAGFFNASASSFINMYVGVGPANVRELFEKAQAEIDTGNCKRAIIFIDEIDAIGGIRTNNDNSEYRNTLNELLNQMDGFQKHDSIIVIAATNTPDSLDQALKRPGRFDRIVHVPLPTLKDREAIIKLYALKIKCADNIDFSKLAQETVNFSQAELKNLVNESAICAVRNKSKLVTQEHFESVIQYLIKRKSY